MLKVIQEWESFLHLRLDAIWEGSCKHVDPNGFLVVCLDKQGYRASEVKHKKKKSTKRASKPKSEYSYAAISKSDVASQHSL